MAEKSSSVLHKLDVTLRIVAALAGTLPMTVMLLSLIARGLFGDSGGSSGGGSGLAEVLVLLLVLPCWLTACCICLLAKSGVRVCGVLALVTVIAAGLLRLVG